MASIVGPNVVAVVHSTNQYTTGLVGGYLIDQLMNQITLSEDNIWGRIGRQFIQTALNGIALHYMIKFIHGDNPRSDYSDPTGGYMLAIGLIQSQPSYMRNGKELVIGFTEFLKEMMIPVSHGATEQEKETVLSSDKH